MLKKKNRRPARHRKEEADASFPALFRGVCKAVVFSLLVGVALLAAVGGALLFTKDPERHRALFSLCILGFSAVLAGALATRFTGKRAPFLAPLSAGALLSLLFSAILLAAKASGAGTTKPLFCLLLLPAAFLGGLLCSRKKRKFK